MKAIVEKQKTGFKFGKYRLVVLSRFGEIKCDGRVYRLVKVRTNNNEVYYSIRLYNAQGKFIKQLLFEPQIASSLAQLIQRTQNEKN